MNENKQMITQSTIIGMGWTKSMIKKLLPEPVQKNNPHYKNAAPMKLWDKSTVLKIMETAEYNSLLEKSKRRKESAAKARKTRDYNFQKYMQDLGQKNQVRMIDDDELIHMVLDEQSYNIKCKLENRAEYLLRHCDSAQEYEEYEQARAELQDYQFHMPSESTLNRWIVNFIRHNLVTYDEDLLKLKGHTGQDDAYVKYKIAVLKKIGKAYPKYKAECDRQIDELERYGVYAKCQY